MTLNTQPIGTPTSPSSQDGLTTADTQSKSLKRTTQGSTKGYGLQSGNGSKKPKQKKCRNCKTLFTPNKPLQCVCSVECALSIAAKRKAKEGAIQARTEALKDRAKRESLKTRGDWIKDAQVAFNKYVRFRDIGKGCISCGADCGSASVGGAGDAGHFRSRGSAPHLRFDERNVHLQCKRCNRYLSGNVADYRIGLIQRIGLEAVEALECDQTSRDHSIEALKAIKAKYSALARELEKACAA